VTTTVAPNAPYSGMLDARERVTGRIAYTINVDLPNMLRGKLLRSPVPHARIARLDVSAARQVPGVHAVLTGQDVLQIPGVFPLFGPVLRDQPILATDKVRFVGEPVVAVAAEDNDAAQQALDLVEVEYEELPAVFDPLAAFQPDAPLLHETAPPTKEVAADLIIKNAVGTNIANHFKLRKGDVEKGFAAADYVYEDTFTSPAVQHVSLETHACVALAEAGRITVWAASQTPHMLRGQLAEIFSVPQAQVRIIVTTLGGGYGGKTYASFEPIAVLLSRITGRPVKIHLTREEEFVTNSKHGVVVKMKTGVKRDGTLVARKVELYYNTGAFAHIGPRVIKNGGYASSGPYYIPNVWVDSYCMYTNTPSAGAFRGFGVSQGAWAYESQMDMIAERLGMDPYELRMKNLLTEGQAFSTNQPMEDEHLHELLEDAAGAIGWDWKEPVVRDGPTVRAKGIASMMKGTLTPSTSSATVKLNEDGSLNVLTSSVEMGQGVKTALAVLAAEQMDMPVEQVYVADIDTDVSPYDQGTVASRSTYSMGQALEGATHQLREHLLQHASELLEASPTDLEITQGRVRVKGVPERGLSFGEIVRRARVGNLQGHGVYRSEGGLDPETGLGIATVHFHQGAGAAEVEVDTETGHIKVLRYHGSIYAGRVVNRVQAELQTEGSIVFGLGQALYEEMLFDNGQLQNGNLADYMIPSLEDLPRLSLSVLEHPTSKEIHGIGETALPAVMPAVANAIARATGVRVTNLPITPEKILRGLREQAASERPHVAAPT
jgi:CO/xanthine dehydrogenase Mo-binding subunit